MVPKFLMADNTDTPEAIYVLHTEYPRFVINLANDEIEWFDQLEREQGVDLEKEISQLIEEAEAFYDREVHRYETID